MTHNHQSWVDLVLGFEDLDPEVRRKAEEHLVACGSCRELLERLRGIERATGPEGALPMPETGERPPFQVEQAEQAERSLRALRRHLGLEPRRPTFGSIFRRNIPDAGLFSTRPPGRRLLLPIAAGAALLLVLLFPWEERNRPLISELGIVAEGTPRGTGAPPGSAVWRTGDGFRIRLRLEKSAFPLLIHLDPAGRISLLHPEDLRGEVPLMPGGWVIELPPPESAVAWAFEGEPGTETFLLVAAQRADLDVPRLLQDLERTASRRGERAAKVRAIADRLRSRIGEVRVIEVEHVR